MAARRLIVILVLLLVASVVAAALAPDRRSSLLPDSTSTTTTTTAPQPTGETLTARIDASAKKPETLEAFAGDQYQLAVGSEQGRTIAIDPLGLSQFAGPESPAHFDLLLRDPGTIPITDATTGEVVGRIDVSQPKTGSPPVGGDKSP